MIRDRIAAPRTLASLRSDRSTRPPDLGAIAVFVSSQPTVRHRGAPLPPAPAPRPKETQRPEREGGLKPPGRLRDGAECDRVVHFPARGVGAGEGAAGVVELIAVGGRAGRLEDRGPGDIASTCHLRSSGPAGVVGATAVVGRHTHATEKRRGRRWGWAAAAWLPRRPRWRSSRAAARTVRQRCRRCRRGNPSLSCRSSCTDWSSYRSWPAGCRSRGSCSRDRRNRSRWPSCRSCSSATPRSSRSPCSPHSRVRCWGSPCHRPRRDRGSRRHRCRRHTHRQPGILPRCMQARGPAVPWDTWR